MWRWFSSIAFPLLSTILAWPCWPVKVCRGEKRWSLQTPGFLSERKGAWEYPLPNLPSVAPAEQQDCSSRRGDALLPACVG